MKNEAAPGPVRILLIEDNPADEYLMRRALDAGEFPYELTRLDNGADALAFIRRQGKYARAARPRVIVMDLHLPKHDGIEILEEIRGTAGFAELPVAVLSSCVSPDERSKVAALKASFMVKARDLDESLSIGNKIKQLALENKKGRARAAVVNVRG